MNLSTFNAESARRISNERNKIDIKLNDILNEIEMEALNGSTQIQITGFLDKTLRENLVDLGFSLIEHLTPTPVVIIRW